MSRSVASTQALINLWETDVVSPQSFNQVYQQTRYLEEDEDITEAIEAWLDSQNNSQLLEAYKNQLRELTASISIESDKKLGMGKSKSPTPAGQSNPSSRELLENAIVKNKPRMNDANSQESPAP